MNAQSIEIPLPPMITPFNPDEPGSPDNPDPLAELLHPFPRPTPELPKVWTPQPEGSFLTYWGLRDNPFADCVHPGFFYRTESHSQAFRDMMLAVEFKASLGLVTGPSGAGKTLVSQLLLQHLDPAKYQTLLILVTPGLSKTGLLREILAELNVPLPVGITPVQDLVRLLGNHVIDLHEQGRRVVVLIDEAHLLSSDCLHIVRTLSNLETPQAKLVTSLLFGESRLSRRLEHASYESLRNRIYLRSKLEPLTPDEAAQYVKFRLMVAGRMDDLFTDGALRAAHAFSWGICRTLNKLCMLSLIKGAADQRALIDESIITASAARI